MSKKGLFNIPIFLLVLLFPIQNIHAEGPSFKRVDSSILKNLSTFHVYTIHPPYRESLKAVSNTFFYSKVNRIAVKLYSGRVDDAHYIDRSYRIAKPAQYYLEITKENNSLLFEIENIMRIKDIKQVEGFGLRIPIRLQALVIEPRIDGKEVSRDENNALYQIRLQFEDHDTYNIESLNLNRLH